MSFVITFTSEINQRFMANILKYSHKLMCDYTNNKINVLSDGFLHNKEERTYELLLKLNYGNHKLMYDNHEIELKYEKTHSTPVATAEDIRYYETLTLGSNNKDILLKYIEEIRHDSSTPEKNDKLLCRILKQGGGWGLLNRINKRPDKTLFMDIDLNELFEQIHKFFNEEDDYIEHGIPFKMNFLFHGIPGTGKTSLIYTIASHFDLDICFLNITRDLDDNAFTKAITNLPDNSILVLEDIDALFVERDSKCAVSFSTVLNVLDGMLKKHKLLTFLTTNYKDRLDSALKRSGRIDYELEFTYATKNQTKKMYNHFFDNNHIEPFMKFVKKLKYTTSDLHKFLFKYRKTDNIMDHIDELVELINKNVDTSPDHLYI